MQENSPNLENEIDPISQDVNVLMVFRLAAINY